MAGCKDTDGCYMFNPICRLACSGLYGYYLYVSVCRWPVEEAVQFLCFKCSIYLLPSTRLNLTPGFGNSSPPSLQGNTTASMSVPNFLAPSGKINLCPWGCLLQDDREVSSSSRVALHSVNTPRGPISGYVLSGSSDVTGGSGFKQVLV